MPGKAKPKAKGATGARTPGTSASTSKSPPKRGAVAKPAVRDTKPMTARKPADIKTKPNDASVEAFINAVPDEQKRKDSFVILEMMKKASGEEPKLWGSSLIGFGNVRLKSPATGREVDWLRIGFSPRKANLSLYLTGDLQKHAAALKKLGKHKTGVGCLYIKTLEDIDMKILKGMMDASLRAGFFGKGA